MGRWSHGLMGRSLGGRGGPSQNARPALARQATAGRWEWHHATSRVISGALGILWSAHRPHRVLQWPRMRRTPDARFPRRHHCMAVGPRCRQAAGGRSEVGRGRFSMGGRPAGSWSWWSGRHEVGAQPEGHDQAGARKVGRRWEPAGSGGAGSEQAQLR